MRVTLGMKAHSGWAAVVVLGSEKDDIVVMDRKRIELVDEVWAKAPYHAAENLKPEEARTLVQRGVESAHRIAVREMETLIQSEQRTGNDVKTCAVLVGTAMPAWSTNEILAVHFRMHKAEGVLFQDALMRAAETCGLQSVAIQEKTLTKQAENKLGVPASRLTHRLAMMGKSLGPPWARDQKDATVAAWIAMKGVLA